jgi:hypothetical protein
MTADAFAAELAVWVVRGLLVGMLAVFVTLWYGRRA